MDSYGIYGMLWVYLLCFVESKQWIYATLDVPGFNIKISGPNTGSRTNAQTNKVAKVVWPHIDLSEFAMRQQGNQTPHFQTVRRPWDSGRAGQSWEIFGDIARKPCRSKIGSEVRGSHYLTLQVHKSCASHVRLTSGNSWFQYCSNRLKPKAFSN